MGSRFTWAPNAAKNIDYIEKWFKQTKVVHNEISYKKLNGQISVSTVEVELKSSTDFPFLKYYNAQEWECIFTLGLNTPKDIDYIEKLFKQKLHRIIFPIKNSEKAYLYLP